MSPRISLFSMPSPLFTLINTVSMSWRRIQIKHRVCFIADHLIVFIRAVPRHTGQHQQADRLKRPPCRFHHRRQSRSGHPSGFLFHRLRSNPQRRKAQILRTKSSPFIPIPKRSSCSSTLESSICTCWRSLVICASAVVISTC